MIDQKTIEAVERAIKIEEVIGDFIELKRSGANMWGICPFHDEKTPSFSVSPAKGFYKCFGCGEKGNAISFVMKRKQCSFPEAIRHIAAKYHIDVIETQVSDEELARRKERETFTNLYARAQKEFCAHLDFSNPVVAKFADSTAIYEYAAKLFSLGFCPSNRVVSSALLNEGYAAELLVKAQISADENRDTFENLITLPITTTSGKTIAFAGINADGEVVKCDENEHFSKRTNLFGIAGAVNEMQKQNSCIVVFSPVEMMLLHAAGIKNCIAPIEPVLTRQNIDLIGRFCKNITLVSTNKEQLLANTTAVISSDLGVKIFHPNTPTLRDYITSTDSAEIQLQIQNQKQTFIDFVASKCVLSGVTPLETIDYLSKMVARIPDDIRRAMYVSSLAKVMKVTDKVIMDRVEFIRMNSATK